MADNRLRKKIGKGRHMSTIKRQRQNETREVRNRDVKTAMRTVIKAVKAAIVKKNKDVAQAALKKALPVIAKTAQKGVIQKATANRYKSRLTIAVQRLA